MALLMALHQAKFDVVAGHVNHGLRGAESDGDEEFVLQFCSAQNIKVQSGRVQLESSSEDAARRARYAVLCEMARAHRCTFITTGHTADDLLETVLMNWLRGASVAGLAGIPAQRDLGDGLVLTRPLLSATRDETREFCRVQGLSWREDSSNASSIYTRNRVRQLLPELAQAARVAPGQLARQTARAAQLWRQDNEWLDALASEKLELLTLQKRSDSVALNGVRFAELPPPLGRRVLRLAAQGLNPLAREIGSEPIETARRHIADAGRHVVWQWPGQIHVEWTGPLAGNRILFRVVRGIENLTVHDRESIS